jgi:hypothetical protein
MITRFAIRWTLAFLFAIASTGCVIIPIPGSVDEIEGAERGAEMTVAPGESIAIIGDRGVDDDSGHPECLREEVEKASAEMRLDLRIIGVSQFQQTLYPWFDPVRRPESIDALEFLLREPEVQEGIASLNLRYLIHVSGHDIEGELEGPAVPHLLGGVASWHKETILWADVWDVTRGTAVGKVRVDASSDGGFLGYALYGLWLAPSPEGAACRGLGRTLAALIAGAEVPEDVREFVEEDMLRRAELEARVEKGDRAAASALVAEFGDTEGLRVLAETRDIEAAKELVRITGETNRSVSRAADDGDLAAAILLARHANDSAPIRALAESGDYEAAHILAAEFHESSYLQKRAEEGDVVAAYALYRQSRNRTEPSEVIAGWRWLCVAANTGYSKAQAEIGYWHLEKTREIWQGWNEEELELMREVGVRSDNRTAYMWYALAASKGDESVRDAMDYYLPEQLSEAEIVRAEQMVREWKPGDCPSSTQRLVAHL